MRQSYMRALALALLVATNADAADRPYPIGSFERLRVDGPFEVHVAPGLPGAHVSGDPRRIGAVAIEVDGDTLVVRRAGDAGSGTSGAPGAVLVVTLTTPVLRSAAVNAGGRVTIARMAAPRLQLSVNGAGAIAAAGVEGEELTGTVIGAGTLTLAGHAQTVRLLTNGPGTIDASALVASTLSVRLDGTGETRANARFTAEVTTTGLGRVVVTGKARCTVKAQAGGPVECGAGQ